MISYIGFFLYFVTVIGCYAGVTLVLFLWGFAKEISAIIIPILIDAFHYLTRPFTYFG